MAKIVYNACYGGFGISEAAIIRYGELKGLKVYPEPYTRDSSFKTYWTVPPEQRGDYWNFDFKAASKEERIAYNKFYEENTISHRGIPRTDPALAQVVEELGDLANGMCAKLRIAEIPDGGRYRIEEYDGYESVETPEDTLWEIA